jgi:hypothetical protein
MNIHITSPAKHSPPGFEGLPQFKYQKHSMFPKEPSYPTIQTVCAKKWNIFLPSQGYFHPMVDESDSLDQLYEMAYRNEFRKPMINSQNPK